MKYFFRWQKELRGAACALVVCALVYAVFLRTIPGPQIQPLRESALTGSNEYKYIDPLVGLTNSGAPSTQYQALKDSVQSYIDSQEQSGRVDTVSILFNDYTHAAGFTINGREHYNPASLLKVPVMIAYYHLAEKNPSVLAQQLTFTGANANTQEHIVSPVQLKQGYSYSVEELIEHMIDHSDNNAAQMLIDNLNSTGQQDVLNKLFTNLGVTQLDLSTDFITVQGYSLFFRVLYNSTYLSREYSEKALELLTKTDFASGLEAGVPNPTDVAQKFGEFTVQSSDGTLLKRELHNCGIIFYPSHPYMLCVMTKGSDFTELENVIAGISQKIYQYEEKDYTK